MRAAASRAAATGVLAVCWSARDWRLVDAAARAALGEGTRRTGGFVWEGQQVANLPRRLCRRLDRIVSGGRLVVDKWSAWAFKNLTHEALHVAGVEDEARAECFALQRMAATVAAAGLPRAYGERLARLSWKRYGRLRRVEPRYFSPECRDGGALDLAPRSSRWPTA